MVEFKTLKDFEIISYEGGLNKNRKKRGLCEMRDLKQEAIKHIKVLRTNSDTYCCFCDDDFGERMEDNTGTQDWIMDFFNITEEDLK